MLHRARVLVVLAAVIAALPILAQPPPAAPRTLDIYVVDTEGGGAKLFVLPSGQSVLIDTGNPGGRDTDRITAAMDAAGVRQLDYVILTHYHVDHVGGLQLLAQHVPIRHYVDHGPTVEAREQVAGFQELYATLYGGAQHTVARPGDTLALTGVDWRIVSSAGKTITTALPGGGQKNPFCAGPNSQRRPETPTDENGQSVGSVITYGKFRAVDLGDLLWDRELDLMCPSNPIGPVDLYLVSHHGTDPSGSDALVHGLNPRVAIMQNGTRKGGTLQTYQALRSAPRRPDIWQAHWSYNGGIEYNPPGLFIANLDDAATIASVLTTPVPAPGTRGRGAATPPHVGAAAWIKVSATSDGAFTVTNTRNRFTRTYPAK
jgi:beta-lactamase superfamily II metal-dependent hydrolase